MASKTEQSLESVLDKSTEYVVKFLFFWVLQETGADFFETSAKTGYMVQQCVVALAAKLQVRQDYIMENALLMLGATEETRNGCPLSVDDEDDDRHLDEDGGNKCCSI